MSSNGERSFCYDKEGFLTRLRAYSEKERELEARFKKAADRLMSKLKRQQVNSSSVAPNSAPIFTRPAPMAAMAHPTETASPATNLKMEQGTTPTYPSVAVLRKQFNGNVSQYYPQPPPRTKTPPRALRRSRSLCHPGHRQ